MNKKFLSVILFSALMLGSTGMFTSCKDYDDDIKSLQDQMDKKASLEDLNAKVTTLQTAVSEAKTAATEAKAKAQEALDKAGEGGSGVSQADLDALKKALEGEIAKLASLDAMNAKIASLKTELEAKFISDEDLKALATKVDTLSAQIMAIIGHRLTSLSVIPTSHINGIAAVTFTTLQYTPQKYQAMATHDSDPSKHATTPVLDHVGTGNARYISTSKNKAYFHVSPSVGIRATDIKTPSFNCMISQNVITKAGVDITNNKPIEVTGHSIAKEGVLEVTFKKHKDFLGKQINTTTTGSTEKFYMASLKTPISADNYTDTEKKDIAAGTIDGVYVNSEYVRVEEFIKLPYLTNSRTDYSKATTGNFADEKQVDGNGSFFVHYHDSVCLYKSDANNLIDVYQAYDKALDLKKLVKVCVSDLAKDHAKHEGLDNYKDYGLTFRFRLAKAAYIPQTDNTNKTDQQKFAVIDSPMNGKMTSKVYDISGSATSVGREPIVCVELIDSLNGNALVAQRYLKVKWTMEGKSLDVKFNPVLFSCGVENLVNTEMMNTMIYDKAKEGGMTKNEFHSIYTAFEAATDGDGVAIDMPNTEEGVESHNILWTLDNNTLGTIWPATSKDFKKVVTYKDPKGINADIKVTLTRTVYMPTLSVWGHMGTYWAGDKKYEQFKINPIVYGTEESNPAWNANANNATNPTCNIYTDLLNGFLDDRGVKPTLGAAGSVYYSDKNVASTKFYYPDFAPKQAGATQKENANKLYYNTLGVKFVFDAAKIANYSYTWKDGSKKKAVLKNGDTELWINNELAATIVNYVDNKINASEKTYNIKLEEAKPEHPVTDFTNQPTDAARALVGDSIPVKMIADLCNNSKNVTTVKAYEAKIIAPLNIKEGKINNFTDAKNEGSSIYVTNAFTYTSWNDNNQVVAKTGKGDLPDKLYKFYQVRDAIWPLTAADAQGKVFLDVSKIKTNLKLENGNLEPDNNGYKQGNVPANVKIQYEQKVIDGKLEEVLTYYNYSGTPVNKEYKLYIPVEYGYKWKTITKVYEITVSPNSGTNKSK